MNKIIMFFAFISNFSGDVIAQREVIFTYYGLKYKIETDGFLPDKINTYSGLNIESFSLSKSCKDSMLTFFTRHNFDSYMIFDFSMQLSDKLSQTTNEDKKKYLLAILISMDYQIVLIGNVTNYYIGIGSSTDFNNLSNIENHKYHIIDDSLAFKNKPFVLYIHNGKNELKFNWNKKWHASGHIGSFVREILVNDSLYVIKEGFDTGYINYIQRIPLALTDSIINIPSPSFQFDSTIQILKEVLKNMQPTEKVYFLLNMCQQVFYTDDLILYGHEVLSLPETTLFLNTGDCEDKSLLLSYLLWHVIGFNSILITYPNGNHMNVGVEMDIEGLNNRSIIQYKNKKYVICEPSGLWYNIGEQISDINLKNPIIIKPIFH